MRLQGQKGSGLNDDLGRDPWPECLAALFRENGEGLAGAVRGILGARADVAEVLQDAFLKALRAGRESEALRDPKAWLFVLVLNLARDQGRRERRREPGLSLEEVSPMRLVAGGPPPSAGIENQEAVAAARVAIRALRDAEREVFLLRVSGELSFEAIAASLGIPVGTAKSRMRLALGRLREGLARFVPAAVPHREES